jgi:hypothetical protein
MAKAVVAPVAQAKDNRFARHFESPKLNSGESKIKPRTGKTTKDHKSGAWARSKDNKDQRASWRNDSKATANNFPYTTCNGKANRTCVTGRGNKRVVYTYTCK